MGLVDPRTTLFSSVLFNKKRKREKEEKKKKKKTPTVIGTHASLPMQGKKTKLMRP